MGKSSTKLDKLFDNNNENIKIIERLPQVKISELAIILYLHTCSEVIIRHYSNVKSYINLYTVNYWKRLIK